MLRNFLPGVVLMSAAQCYGSRRAAAEGARRHLEAQSEAMYGSGGNGAHVRRRSRYRRVRGIINAAVRAMTARACVSRARRASEVRVRTDTLAWICGSREFSEREKTKKS